MPKTQPEPIRDPVSDRLLTPENCALVLIDYQPEQYRTVTLPARRRSGRMSLRWAGRSPAPRLGVQTPPSLCPCRVIQP